MIHTITFISLSKEDVIADIDLYRIFILGPKSAKNGLFKSIPK